MDGTMVDNMNVHNRAWQLQLASIGIDMSIEEVKATCHGKNEEIFERLFGDRFTPEQRRQYSREKEERYREVFLHELKLIEGLSAFLEVAHAAGIPMGIGTAAPPENVNFVLDNLPIRSYFKKVVDAGQVQRGKPDPAVFQMVAEGIGVPIHQCLVFEDSPTGAETALRAGCPAIILTTTHDQEEFAHFTHIKAFVSDFTGLNPLELLRFLPANA
ncbi:MAG: HAD family phosphatase [Bacteroidetes bacterium]|nr:MAG: HAD family phosphatase [Bacteroidota bacterium]